MFLLEKISAYTRARKQKLDVKATDKELCKLQHKIDKLLCKIHNSKNTEPVTDILREEECVVCMNDKACMQTIPCGHVVLCRACFVRTIQSAVKQRNLPLTCVLCRQRILRVARTPALTTRVTFNSSTSKSGIQSTRKQETLCRFKENLRFRLMSAVSSLPARFRLIESDYTIF